MPHIQKECSSHLQTTTEQISLYQSIATTDGYGFVIRSLEDRTLAMLSIAEARDDNRWTIESEPLNIEQARELGRELHRQHYQFYIYNGRFRITAWNLLDAHYICNLIALHDLGWESLDDIQTAA